VGEDQVANRLGFPRDYFTQRLIQKLVAKLAGDLVELRLGRFRSKADLYETFILVLEMQVTPIGKPIGNAQQR